MQLRTSTPLVQAYPQIIRRHKKVVSTEIDCVSSSRRVGIGDAESASERTSPSSSSSSLVDVSQIGFGFGDVDEEHPIVRLGSATRRSPANGRRRHDEEEEEEQGEEEQERDEGSERGSLDDDGATRAVFPAMMRTRVDEAGEVGRRRFVARPKLVEALVVRLFVSRANSVGKGGMRMRRGR